MKQAILTLTVMIFWTISFAQNDQESITGGIVTYEQTVKLDIQLEGDAAEFAHMLPKERKTKKELFFNNEASLYKVKKEEEEEITNIHEEGMVIKMKEPDDIVFTDFKNKKQIEQREFMSRLFLIESDMNSKGWKITGKQKEILGYKCQEAFKEEDDKKISAWFTPEIPISAGPGQIVDLPGFVLEVNINEGEHIVTAIQIDKKTIDETILIQPKKGKKVSQEEFKKIVDEKMKEMGIENGGGGNKMIIKIKH